MRKIVPVRGYRKKNGTYVPPYRRSPPKKRKKSKKRKKIKDHTITKTQKKVIGDVILLVAKESSPPQLRLAMTFTEMARLGYDTYKVYREWKGRRRRLERRMTYLKKLGY